MTFFYELRQMDLPELAEQQVLTLALCGYWMYFGGPAGSNGWYGGMRERERERERERDLMMMAYID